MGVSLFIGIVLYGGFYFKWNQNSNISRAAENMSEIFKARSIEAEKVANKFIEYWKINEQAVEPLFKENKFQEGSNGFSIRLYQRDKLIYWNNQKAVPRLREEMKTGIYHEPSSGNIYYLIPVKESEFSVVVSDLIFEQHAFTNRYIQSGFTNAFSQFRENYLPSSVEEGEAVISDVTGIPVFGLRKTDHFQKEYEGRFMLWNSFLILLNLSLLYALIYYALDKKKPALPIIQLTLFAANILFVLLLLLFFEPLLNQHSNIFTMNELWMHFPGLHFFHGGTGLYFLHGFLAFCIALNAKSKCKTEFYKIENHSSAKALMILLAMLIITYGHYWLVNAIAGQSTGILQITRLHEFDWEGMLAILYIIGLSLVAIYLLAISFQFYLRAKIAKGQSLAMIVGILVLTLIIFYKGDENLRFVGSYSALLLFFVILIPLIGQEHYDKQRVFLFVLILLISSQLTYLLYKDNRRKSVQSLELAARQLSFEKDPLFEFLWRSVNTKLVEDKHLREILSTNKGSDDNEMELEIARYIEQSYFPDYFKKFDIWISLCRQESRLFIPTQNDTVGCRDYFKSLVEQHGKPAEALGLFLLEDPRQGLYYLADVPLTIPNLADGKETPHLLIEFYQKLVPKGLGYLELLTDQFSGLPKQVGEYSIAIYQNGELLYKVGKRMFPANYESLNPDESTTFNSKYHQSYVHKVNDQRMLVVSQPKPSWSVVMAPFSFFFLILLLPLLGQLIGWQSFSFSHTFRFRLQTLLLGSLLLSILILGSGSIFYITEVYDKKNDAFLFEKTQSILIELENKIGNNDFSNPETLAYFQERLSKLSLVFFSDINIYNTEGQLITSSRHDIYEHHLLSAQMNPDAYYSMKFGHDLYYKQNENISGFEFLSSYVPLTQQSGKLIAFVNLPYFARETEMQNELSSLVMTYINLFILIAGLAFILVLMISRPLLEPLQMIQDKMRGIRIGHTNEKISWKRRDEIGQLVREYNNLIDQLAISAEKLAKSERESAWREMARQIAHEIKNPLTPMRLSVQYLLKAWNDKDTQIDDKIKMTSQTIINQIDTLSSIATAFSDFARMPENNTGKVELISLLRELIVLFDNQQSIEFILETGLLSEIYLSADRSGLHRVFTNLIKNSIQAIGERSDGKIEIVVESFKGFSKIIVRDNGKGMLPDEAKRVFSPNFTTKTSGMGIGLAMVYNLVKAFGGNIDFETEMEKGTTFIIQIPLYQDDVAKSD